MEPSPIVAVIQVVGAAIGAVIIAELISRYSTRKWKRDYKKTTGRDYDEFVAWYMQKKQENH